VALVLVVRLPSLSAEGGLRGTCPDWEALFGGGRRAFGSLVSNRRARSALLVSFLVWFGFFAVYTYTGAFLEDRLGLDTARVGLVTLTVGVGYLIGGQLGGRLSDRIGRKSVVIAGLVLLGAVLVTVFRVHSLPVAVAGILAMGFGFFFTYSAQVTLMTELVPEARSTTMSVNYFVTYIGVTAGSTVGGIILARCGYELVGVVSASACLIAAFVAYRFVFSVGNHEGQCGQLAGVSGDSGAISVDSEP
jgi:DHA1 family inner membrane transport protein